METRHHKIVQTISVKFHRKLEKYIIIILLVNAKIEKVNLHFKLTIGASDFSTYLFILYVVVRLHVSTAYTQLIDS